MKVKNLYMGKIIEVKDVKVTYHYNDWKINPFVRVSCFPSVVEYKKKYIRLSLFYKSNNRMHDIIYGGKYKYKFNIDRLQNKLDNRSIQYVDAYRSISNSFDSKNISKCKLVKMYKDSIDKYNKNGGKNE